MNLKPLWGLLLLNLPLWLAAQTSTSDSLLETQTFRYFETLQQVPQEKLYLHIDKPVYGAGNPLWFRGYLVNAISHVDNSPSNFIYLELLSRKDSVVQRFKFKRDSAGFRGCIPLSDKLPTGEYTLRGYTQWMRNNDPDFFFYRPLYIGNILTIKPEGTIKEEPSAQNGNRLTLQFADAQKTPLQGCSLSYRLYDPQHPETATQGKALTDSLGQIQLSQLPDTRFTLEVRSVDAELAYEQTFYVENENARKDYAVSFFPEGGALLCGVSQTVAFQAQASTGFSLPVQGVVTNTQGDTVASLRSEHNGMGSFLLQAVAGEHYTAHVRAERGEARDFQLPTPDPQALGITMAVRNENLLFQIRKSETAAWPETLYLLGHLRGEIRVFMPISSTQPSGKISTALFPDGILHFLLVDGNGTPRSERLLFIRHPESTQFQVTADKPRYGAREAVNLQLNLRDLTGAPLTGTFSVSITDHNLVAHDSLSDNLLSNLWLTSDLKGSIEQPGYYFQTPYDATRQRHLDLVMLTHGWRRFHIESLLTPPAPTFSHFIEVGQTLSGTITNSFGKPASEIQLTTYASSGAMFLKKSDAQGRFLVDTLQFNDTTALMLQASNSKGKTDLYDIKVDPDSFPAPLHLHPFHPDTLTPNRAYLQKARDQYYQSADIQTIALDEVEVEAVRKEKDVYASMADVNIETEQVPEYMRSQLVLNYLSTLTGFQRNGDQLSLRGNSTPPLVLIDEVPYDNNRVEVLQYLYMNEVASISIIKGANAAFFGTRGGSGVISIRRKKGSSTLSLRPSHGITFITPLGYHEITEFYHPVYETPEQRDDSHRDLRTTLYWNPLLSLDANGEASIRFYTADQATSYHLQLEGITAEGYPVAYDWFFGQ